MLAYVVLDVYNKLLSLATISCSFFYAVQFVWCAYVSSGFLYFCLFFFYFTFSLLMSSWQHLKYFGKAILVQQKVCASEKQGLEKEEN